MLEHPLLQSFSKLKCTRTRKSSVIWQKDNAPGHTSKIVKEWLENNNIKTLKWPSDPDLISLRIFGYTLAPKMLSPSTR